MEILKRRLGNGLSVFLIPMEGARTVTAIFTVRAGWKYEDPPIEGIAHFIEHLTFKGTPARPNAFRLLSEIENFGGYSNAFTETELISYYIRASSKFWEHILSILSDMVLHPLFRAADIRTEKGTIIEEMRRYLSNPTDLVSTSVWPKLLYGNQPAGWTGVGTEESITHLGRPQFIKYHEDLFVAPNSTVVLAGKIEDPNAVFQKISSDFAELTSRYPRRTMHVTEESQQNPGVLFQHMAVPQTSVILGVRTCAIHSPDRYPLAVLGAILGGGESSRLSIKVREQKGLAYAIGAGASFESDVGYLSVGAGLKKERVAEALKIIMRELKCLMYEPVPEKELTRVKNVVIGELDTAYESPQSVALRVAHQWGTIGAAEDIEDTKQRLLEVTADYIQRVAVQFFRDDRLNLALVGPHRREEIKTLRPLLTFTTKA